MIRFVLFIAAALAASAPALSAELPATAPCREQMKQAWPHMLPGPDRDAMADALIAITRLKPVCAGDDRALDDLAYAGANLDYILGDPAAAIAALDDRRIPPTSPIYARSQWLYLAAAALRGDADRYRTARDTFLAAHDVAMQKMPGVSKIEHFATPLAEIDAYRTGEIVQPYLFVARSRRGGPPVSLKAGLGGAPNDKSSYYVYNYNSCWGGGPNQIDGDFDAAQGDVPDYAVVRAAVVKTFSAHTPQPPQGMFPVEQSEALPQFTQTTRPVDTCPDAKEVLPAFAEVPKLTGAEYAQPGDPLSLQQIDALLHGTDAQQKQVTDYVLAHPDSVPPFDLIFVTTTLMAQGNMAKAAFWYQIYKIRITPWEIPRSEPEAAAANDVYAVMAEYIGHPLDEWAASDFEAFRTMMLRASRYERKLPLYPGRPDGVSEADWKKRVAEARAAHDAAALDKAVPDTAQTRKRVESERKAHGFYVGPWQSPGEPLPDDWR